MHPSGSVTHMLGQLRSEEPEVRDEAAQQIWQRYAHLLLRLARDKLDRRIRPKEDEQDVLQSMYKSFCLRQQRGDFHLDSRDQLWQLLVTITLRKVRNVAKRQRRECRDYRREEVGAAVPAGPSATPWSFEEMEGPDPTPEEVAVLSEEFERRLEELPEPLRQIALWKLDGYSNEEIAGPDKLDCSPRTVERKLERIRRHWERQAGGTTS